MIKNKVQAQKTGIFKAQGKTILLLLVLTLIQISLVFAWEFDNVKDYDELTKTATITNALGLGETIAEVKLISPQINYVIRGKDRLVAEFEINNFDDYTNVFNNMEFYNIKKGMTLFDREFVYKYEVVTGSEEVPIYEEVCNLLTAVNGTKYNSCTQKITGATTREIKEWRVLDEKVGLQKGVFKVGIFTDVEADERVEWIPELFGEKIEEWAEWTESLNVNIYSYYNFEEASGNLIDRIAGVYNGTLFNTPTQQSLGRVNYGYGFVRADSEYVESTTPFSACDDLNCSFSIWFNTSLTGTYMTPLSFYDKDVENYMVVQVTNTNVFRVFKRSTEDVSVVGSSSVSNGAWHMISVTFNSTNMSLYLDGSLVGYTDKGSTFTMDNLGIGTQYVGGYANYFNGNLDEVGVWDRELTASEITQIYNGSLGLTYIPPVVATPPTVTLLTPVNNTQTTSQVDDFTFNITTPADWTNFTFKVWNDEDTSIKSRVVVNGTPDADCTPTYQGNNIIVECIGQAINTDDAYHWNVEGCLDNGLCAWATSNFTFTIDTTKPAPRIIYPANTSYNINVTNLNYTYIELLPDRCWYSRNGGTTNSSTSSCNVNFTILGTEGSTTLKLYMNDTFGNENSTSVTYYQDSIFPEINITYPSNYTNTTDNTIDVNYTYVETFPNNCWWTEDYGTTNTTLTCGENITTETWAEGEHDLYIYINDSLGNTNYSGVHFSIDTTKPTITFVQLGNIDYHIINTNLSINWTVTDTHIDTCLLEYAGTNYSVGCGDNNLSLRISSFNYKNATMFANDTLGNTNTSTMNWNYYVFQNEANFTPSTIEGSTETFTLNFTKSTSFSISSINLIYNSTTYASTISTSGSDTIGSNSIIIPSIGADMNKTLYWNVTFTDANVVSTNSYNQSVQAITIDDCSVNTNLINNYTSYDEETKAKLSNTTIEIQVVIYDIARTNLILNLSKSYVNINGAGFCLSVPLLNNTNYSMDSTVKYTSNSSGIPYAIEYYHILNYTLANTTIPKNIALYNLKSADSTDFQLTFKDSSLSLAPNILIYVYRQYVADGNFKIVEVPLTDSNGQTVLHLVRNDIIYNFVMKDISGNIIGVFNSITAFCQDYTIGSCTINLDALSSGTQIYERDNDLGISYSTDYSDVTSLISFDFVSNDLTTKDVELVVVRNSDFGNRTVCRETLSASSGTITCDVSTIKDTDRFLFINIYVDGYQKAIETIDLEADTSGFDTTTGAFLGFLMMIFLITMFMEDKQLLIVAIVIGWIICISLGLIKGALFGVLSSGIWLVVTAFLLIWKLKKEEAYF